MFNGSVGVIGGGSKDNHLCEGGVNVGNTFFFVCCFSFVCVLMHCRTLVYSRTFVASWERVSDESTVID